MLRDTIKNTTSGLPVFSDYKLDSEVTFLHVLKKTTYFYNSGKDGYLQLKFFLPPQFITPNTLRSSSVIDTVTHTLISQL